MHYLHHVCVNKTKHKINNYFGAFYKNKVNCWQTTDLRFNEVSRDLRVDYTQYHLSRLLIALYSLCLLT